MTKANNRHVVPGRDGGWDVRAPHARRASAHADTQAEAARRAREIVGNLGGGEVIIHGRDGKIRDSDTVAPGNDPFPPRDTR
jgi:butyrate kinase